MDATSKISPNPVPRVTLATFGGHVIPPPGIVYSTEPRRGEGDDGRSYFIKNTAPEVVFAEIAGCHLARRVGLPAPNVAACVWENEGLYAGSERVSDFRQPDAWISQPRSVANWHDLYEAVAVDVWLANFDRNYGSVVIRPYDDALPEFVFVDFEKSVTLRPNPIIQTTLVEPKKLWPSGELGTLLARNKPLPASLRVARSIRELTREDCEDMVTSVVNAMEVDIDWAPNSIDTLIKRANKIDRLLEEVWATV